MVNEPVLLDTLLSLLQHTRNQLLFNVASSSELVALRNSVRGLDPTFDEVLKQKQSEIPSLENAREIIAPIDEAIARLKVELLR
jgi:hypothetical protein